MTAQNPTQSSKSSKARRERKKRRGRVPEERASKGEGRPEKAVAVSGNAWERSKRFLQGVWVEVKRVSWPSRTETVAGTLVVLFTLILFAVYLGGFDAVLTRFFSAVGH